jgi:iron complex transport system ATP-binding protein
MVLTLKVEHLRFRYGERLPLLEDVSFELAEGDVFCLLGPNGSGKTTLLRCLLGVHRLMAGVIQVGSRSLAALTAKELAREVAYVPQHSPAVFPYTAFDVVLMGRSPHLRGMGGPTATDRNMALAAMQHLGIAHLGARRFPELSGGEQQLVLIARALAQGSKILIMDEPTANLDYGNQVRILHVLHTLAREGYSILMSSHVPDHAFLVCNKVALLKKGRMHGPGAPQEILTDAVLSNLYGTAIRVVNVQLSARTVVDRFLCVPLMDNQKEIGDDAQGTRVPLDAGRSPAWPRQYGADG